MSIDLEYRVNYCRREHLSGSQGPEAELSDWKL
jgi:hypothetical protein